MASAPPTPDEPDEGKRPVPTTRAEVFERVKNILIQQLGVDADQVSDDASFQEDLDADSLDLVELIMELEDQMGITISDQDAQKLTTVGEAVDYICKALNIQE